MELSLKLSNEPSQSCELGNHHRLSFHLGLIIGVLVLSHSLGGSNFNGNLMSQSSNRSRFYCYIRKQLHSIVVYKHTKLEEKSLLVKCCSSYYVSYESPKILLGDDILIACYLINQSPSSICIRRLHHKTGDAILS